MFALKLGRVFSWLIVVSVVGAALPVRAQFGSKPSFGVLLTSKKIELTRKLPPIYDLHGKKILVAVTAEPSNAAQTTAELQSEIEKLLTTQDSTVRVETHGEDLRITCQITHYVAPNVQKSGTGTSTVSTLTSGMNVAFRIIETRTGHVIAASVASSQIMHEENFLHMGKSKGAGAKEASTAFDAQNAMVGEVARQIASYLVITPEPVTVQLAVGGELNTPNKLASNYLWTRYLEALSELKPFPDEREDAYRFYDIGVANEALAYATKDVGAAQRYLQEASINYGKAVEGKADEKDFLPAQTRIGAALAHFAATKDLAATASKPERESPPPPPPPAPKVEKAAATPAASASSENGTSQSNVLKNQDVIDMVKGGVDASQVIDTIKEATQVQFDLSPKGLIALSSAGVNKDVQAAMRSKSRSEHRVAR
jgi:hypothetical protein